MKKSRLDHRSGKRYMDAISQLGLGQTDAARFLEIDPRTSRRYARGEWPIPPAIEMLFGIMLKHKVIPEQAKQFKA